MSREDMSREEMAEWWIRFDDAVAHAKFMISSAKTAERTGASMDVVVRRWQAADLAVAAAVRIWGDPPTVNK